LDYLVWQLVIANAEQPTVRTAFPVVMKHVAWPATVTDRLRGVADDWVAEIDKCQPYHRREHPEWHPLAILDRVNNNHKHRMLPVSITSAEHVAHRINVEPMAAGDNLDFEFSDPDQPIRHGARALKFRWRERQQRLEVDLASPPTVRASFQDGIETNWTNDSLFDWVAETVRRFEPAF
jgi:hypothetical protein